MQTTEKSGRSRAQLLLAVYVFSAVVLGLLEIFGSVFKGDLAHFIAGVAVGVLVALAIRKVPT